MFLQRATAGFRRTTLELTDGNHDNNHPSTSSTASENPVTMEMNSSPPVRDDSCSSNNNNLEGLYCSEIHVEEEEAAQGDEDGHPILKTEGEAGGEEQDEDYGWREVINERDEGGWEVKGEEELDEPENGDKEEMRTENLRKVEGENEVDEWVTEMLGEKKQDSSSALLLTNENPSYLLFQHPAVTAGPPEAALQESWRWEDSGKTDDFNDGPLSDCLQAKLALVYPESDAEEDQWAALSSCDNTSHIEESDLMTDSTFDTESKEEGIFSVETEMRVEEQGEEEVKGEDREEDEDQMKSGRDLILQSPSISSMSSSVDSDRRVSFTLLIFCFCVLKPVESSRTLSLVCVVQQLP